MSDREEDYPSINEWSRPPSQPRDEQRAMPVGTMQQITLTIQPEDDAVASRDSNTANTLTQSTDAQFHSPQSPSREPSRSPSQPQQTQQTPQQSPEMTLLTEVLSQALTKGSCQITINVLSGNNMERTQSQTSRLRIPRSESLGPIDRATSRIPRWPPSSSSIPERAMGSRRSQFLPDTNRVSTIQEGRIRFESVRNREDNFDDTHSLCAPSTRRSEMSDPRIESLRSMGSYFPRKERSDDITRAPPSIILSCFLAIIIRYVITICLSTKTYHYLHTSDNFLQGEYRMLMD